MFSNMVELMLTELSQKKLHKYQRRLRSLPLYQRRYIKQFDVSMKAVYIVNGSWCNLLEDKSLKVCWPQTHATSGCWLSEKNILNIVISSSVS